MEKKLAANSRQLSAGLVVWLLIGTLAMLAGCGGKQPVKTDTTALEPVAPSVIAPAPVTPEEPDAGSAMPAINYAEMEPSAYGIQDVFFPFDVHALSDAAMKTLAANAAVMRGHPDLTWMIEGHCDERGTVEYNLALGEKRAKATRDYLASLGIPVSQLQTTSYGEERPFVQGRSEAAWAQNRRAHFARSEAWR